MTTPLPKEVTDRIEREAKAYQEQRWNHGSFADQQEPWIIAATREAERSQVLVKAVKAAHEILTLAHPELSNVEMNTLTTRQYMLWKEHADVLASYLNPQSESEK